MAVQPLKPTRTSVLVAGVVMLLSSPIGATTYYVSPNGSDGNGGRSETSPWQTLPKVNVTTFAPGDSVLFKCGGTWQGSLSPRGSGTSALQIMLSSYGTGAKPSIDGQGTVYAAILLKDVEYWTISGFDVTNNHPAHDEEYHSGIQAENTGSSILHGIRILQNYVHEAVGSDIAGAGIDGPRKHGGISVLCKGTDGLARYDDVLIEGNTVLRCGRLGITVWDNAWSGPNEISTNVVIRRNEVGWPRGDGIIVYGVQDALIEYNICHHSGQDLWGGWPCQAGIWVTRGRRAVIQYNEAYDTRYTGCDAQGFDVDVEQDSTIVQYNYSHDNEGGFILLMGSGPGTHIRYNLSVNDNTAPSDGVINADGTNRTRVYNNTFYLPRSSKARFLYGQQASSLSSFSFNNNIVCLMGTHPAYGSNVGVGTYGYNLFYGQHPAGEPSDAHKLTGDPMFADTSTGKAIASAGDWSPLSRFKLKPGSPALGSGMVMSGNGGKDFWGNPVSATAAPNRGAYEGAGWSGVRVVNLKNMVAPVASCVKNTVHGTTLQILEPSRFTAEVLDLRGRVFFRRTGYGPERTVLPSPGGAYIATLTTASGTYAWQGSRMR